MKFKKSISFILIIFSIIFLSGCDNSVEPLEKGICEVNVSGYVVKSYQGQALFDKIPNGRGNKLFFLLLKDVVEPGKNYRIVTFQGSQPEVGTHNLFNFENKDDSIKSVLLGRYDDSEVEGSFKSLGGNIEIYLSTDKELKGRAEFSAYENVSLGNGQSTRAEIKIIAEFYAEQGYTGIIIN
jgi:hypothetical protein